MLAFANAQLTTKLNGLPDGKLQVHFYNDGPAVHVLAWNTPLLTTDFESEMFNVVSASGEPAIYVGKLAKRGDPVPEDWITIEAKQTFSVTVDLSSGWLLSNETTYTVALSTTTAVLPVGALLNSVSASQLSFVPLTSEPEIVKVFNPRQLPAHLMPGAPESNAPPLIQCNSQQAPLVTNAIPKAKSASATVLSYMNDHCDETYVKWMGAYQGSSRWEAVTQGYGKINDKLSGSGFSCNCSPPSCSSSSVFAYVYPTDSTFTIYLCGAFWRASTQITTDSQPGTLVHEMSHFRAIVGTQDYVYGQAAAQNLAKTNPAKAAMNADNFEYFAESQPRCTA
jgi:peptidyl-Lys metalloendopeptidase